MTETTQAQHAPRSWQKSIGPVTGTDAIRQGQENRGHGLNRDNPHWRRSTGSANTETASLAA